MKIINGTSGKDHLIGGNQANLMYGYAGNDILEGNKWNDTLFGGAGTDTMIGGKGNDTYYIDNANDTIIENANGGTDTVYSSVSYTLASNVETLILTGKGNLIAHANDQGCTILGNFGNDTLYGGNGDDIFFKADNLKFVEKLEGSAGSNTMYGRHGNDIYLVNDYKDTVIENYKEGYDIVYSTLKNYTLPDNVECGYLVILGNKNLHGNSLNNLLNGNCSSNYIDGKDGDDTIYGGGFGYDTLTGGNGNDKLTASRDNCILSGDNGNDTLYGNQNSDTLYGGSGNDKYAGYKQTFGGQSIGFGHDVINDYTSYNGKLSGNPGYDILDLKNFNLNELSFSTRDIDKDGKIDSLYINCGKYGSIQINNYFDDTSSKINLSHAGQGCIEDIQLDNNIQLHFANIQYLLH